MKKKNLIWGIALILLAVLLILDAFQVFEPLTSVIGEISIWSVILGGILLVFIISRLAKGKLAEIFVPLAFIFMLFEKNISQLCGALTPDLINNWLLLLVAILLSGGVHIILSPFQNRRITSHAVNVAQSANKKRHAESTLGHSTIYIDSETMTPDYIENNLGSCAIYFENAEAYKGNATIRIENNLGSMKIHVPNAWCVKEQIDNNLGGITIPAKNNQDGLILYISGENNLGSVTVTYI